MDIKENILAKAKAAKEASYKLAIMRTEEKNNALLKMADMLEHRSEIILEANALDVEDAKKRNVRRSYLDRLILNEGRIKGMADGLRQTAVLPDPIGEVEYSTIRPNGLEIRQVRVPLGTIGIIYEARPNVTSDAAGLCLKAGNAVMLRGGSDSIRSNKAITSILQKASYKAGIPEGAIQLVDITDHEAVNIMTHLDGYLDVIIPRGGAGLIKAVIGNSTVPVIETGTGICHTFVDDSADLNMALKIAINAKVTRPAVCNAMETLLVHENVAEYFLPMLVEAMKEHGCELRGCERCRQFVPSMKEATDEDWDTEYGDLILSVKIVSSLEEAIAHINAHNTRHSDTIVTESITNAHAFQWQVDASTVYVNASTRFSDGGEFGFGAEIGISTQKLHARGPMGLKALTSTKYMIYGEGQIR